MTVPDRMGAAAVLLRDKIAAFQGVQQALELLPGEGGVPPLQQGFVHALGGVQEGPLPGLAQQKPVAGGRVDDELPVSHRKPGGV